MMNFKKKALITLVMALVASMMVFATGCKGSAPVAYNNANNASALGLARVDANGSSGISVTGQGSIAIKPDVANITLGVVTPPDADQLKARKANDEAMAKVLAVIKGFGIAEDDITTTNFSIYPQYDKDGVNIIGYNVTNTINVKVKNLDKLGDVITAATTAGANMAGGISFDVLDRTATYNEALTQAMANAKARADLMAKALGVTLGKVLTISESSSYSGPTYAVDEAVRAVASKAMSVPTASGQLDVSASVSVVYEIVK